MPAPRPGVLFVAALGLALLGGCASLLPSSKTETVSKWNSYDDVVASLATFTPYQATREQVHAQGLDPRRVPAITVLHFADVLHRFAAAAPILPEHVDRGIRECLQAGRRCTAYTIEVKKLYRQRVGSFWLDSLSFRRETVTTGWSADVLLVFVDDLLVYELIGGQPTIREVEVQRKPLGPLQGFGDQLVR